MSSQLEQAAAASRPGSWTRRCLRPLGPPPAGPRIPGVNCRRFWFTGHVWGAHGGQCWAALCSQATLMPSPRKKWKGGSDWATSFPHWVSDTIVITGGGFLGALALASQKGACQPRDQRAHPGSHCMWPSQDLCPLVRNSTAQGLATRLRASPSCLGSAWGEGGCHGDRWVSLGLGARESCPGLDQAAGHPIQSACLPSCHPLSCALQLQAESATLPVRAKPSEGLSGQGQWDIVGLPSWC